MALQLAPRTSSVCSQSPYSEFLPLQGFTPAVTFCAAFEVNEKVPAISGCPNGNTLCNVLSSLSSCELTIIATACLCIGVTPTTTISVPKTTTLSTSSSKTTSPSSSVKSSATTWSTSSSSPKSTSSSWTTLKSTSTSATSTWATNTCSASTVTVTVTPSAAATCTPSSCVDGAQAVYPPPAGLICQQNGTLSPTNWDLLTDGSATSVSGCAAQCLASDGCLVSEYDYLTQDCQLFQDGDAESLGFIPVAASPFIDSDVGCFVAC